MRFSLLRSMATASFPPLSTGRNSLFPSFSLAKTSQTDPVPTPYIQPCSSLRHSKLSALFAYLISDAVEDEQANSRR